MKNIKKKPIVVLDVSSIGKGGGPYVSTMRLVNSDLKNKYDFRLLEYPAKVGSGISIKRILYLKEKIIELKPDIVHFTGLQLSGFHLAIACKLAHVKNTVLTIHGFSADAIYFNPIKRILLKFIFEPLTLLLVKKFYGVSKYVISRRLPRLFKYKCYGTIYNFPPESNVANENGGIRQELNLAKSDIIVISIARIIKDKGYHILDEAILQLEKYNNLKFVIVGNGTYLKKMEKKLQKQIKNKQVFLLGHRDDIQHILSDCNIFVLPTLHETLSIALLEASVEGLALIGSNTGGVPEIIQNNYNGLLVSPGNVTDLVSAIYKLYSDDILRKKFGYNAKKRISSHFASENIATEINSLYTSLLKKLLDK